MTGPATKNAINVDGATKMTGPATKNAINVDGAGKSWFRVA